MGEKGVTWSKDMSRDHVSASADCGRVRTIGLSPMSSRNFKFEPFILLSYTCEANLFTFINKYRSCLYLMYIITVLMLHIRTSNAEGQRPYNFLPRSVQYQYGWVGTYVPTM